jgi:hypothetical protein
MVNTYPILFVQIPNIPQKGMNTVTILVTMN